MIEVVALGLLLIVSAAVWCAVAWSRSGAKYTTHYDVPSAKKKRPPK